MKKIFSHIASAFHKIKEVCYTRHEKQHSEKYNQRIAFLDKYSLLFHLLGSMLIVFIIEVCSRRSLISAIGFVGDHSLAFLYNSFIIFASLTLVYLFRHRAAARILISFFWLFLGVVNGVVLSKRVTPFGFNDLSCISEVLDMKNSGYLTPVEIVLILVLVAAALFLISILCAKAPLYKGKLHRLMGPVAAAAVLFILLPATTTAAQSAEIVDTYYGNIAQGYQKNGFVYSFSNSVVGTGMEKPEDYSEETVDEIVEDTADVTEENTVDGTTGPNIICILLESFVDPYEINYLDINEDPIPTFHELEENYSSGYMTVPVVGAGTANTEFEVLTGMSLQYFGTGEYPYKTILKQTDCESIASDLSTIGYSTHVVHNNGGNFYSRVNAFSQMGFDTFTSKEMMNITDFTPTGSWAEDAILADETIKTLDSTPGQADFTYTITVGTHGTYPTEAILDDPQYTATGSVDENGDPDEGKDNQWTYYINQEHKTDEFIKDLISQLEERDEDTIVVMWGDHLPTMGLTDEDMKSGDIYKTKYVTWNNMGLSKEDSDLYAYQIMSSITDQVGIHTGTMTTYHQAALHDGSAWNTASSESTEDSAQMVSAESENTEDSVQMVSDKSENTTSSENTAASRSVADSESTAASDSTASSENTAVSASTTFSEKANDISQGENEASQDPAYTAYLSGLEMLQFDILYGERYCYGGADKYPASDIVMGIEDVTINDIEFENADEILQMTGQEDSSTEKEEGKQMAVVTGQNFTMWSYVFVNDEKQDTTYISDHEVAFDASSVKEGDVITVRQLGSGNTEFRTSNEYIWE